MRARLGVLATAGVLLAVGCEAGTTASPAPSTPAAADPSVVEAPSDRRGISLAAPAGAGFVGRTPASGNRWHPGVADLPGGRVELATDHPVAWLLAAPLARAWEGAAAGASAGATLWVGGDGRGAVSAFAVARTADGALEAVALDAGRLGDPGDAPTLVVGDDGAWRFTDRRDAAAGAPVRWLDGRRVVVAGDEARVDGQALSPTPLPDAVAVVAADGRIALPVGPTTAYGHAVLGDGVEARGIAVLRGEDVVVVEAPDGAVHEQRGALWADLDGDGADDLLVTRSDPVAGARLVALTTDDLARRVLGPPVGTGNRWRHVVAVAPVEGVPHVVEVVTPHLARTLRVSRVEGDELVATLEVDTDLVTHTIGSRDLDRAAVLDADGDGVPDLLAPTTDGGLGAWALDGSGWSAVALDDAPTSNLVVVPVPGVPGRLDVGIGTAAGILLAPG